MPDFIPFLFLIFLTLYSLRFLFFKRIYTVVSYFSKLFKHITMDSHNLKKIVKITKENMLLTKQCLKTLCKMYDLWYLFKRSFLSLMRPRARLKIRFLAWKYVSSWCFLILGHQLVVSYRAVSYNRILHVGILKQTK